MRQFLHSWRSLFRGPDKKDDEKSAEEILEELDIDVGDEPDNVRFHHGLLNVRGKGRLFGRKRVCRVHGFM